MGMEEYDVGRMSGKGKFSVVYKAKRKRDNVTVALKKIAVDVMDRKDVEACMQEVALLQAVTDHPNIISYLDSFLDDNHLVIVLEWAGAGDLKRQIGKAQQKSARFDEGLVWKIFNQIASALNHMHDKRTMHRDLKPAHIFLTAKGTIKLGDLGLGRYLSEATMEAFTKVGTPLYMSPEMLSGKKGGGYTWKSDVYSLGCVLYELAMLRAPFKEPGMTFQALCKRVVRGDYQPLPKVFSREMRDLVDSMLDTEPENRIDLAEICAVSARNYEKYAKLKSERREREGKAADAGGKSKK
jgi:NIMA (never in mitosis gene a)-related kinase